MMALCYNLKEVREFLYSVRLKWYDLGLELDVDEEELDVIKAKDKDDPNTCLREMLRVRLKTPLTWKMLGQALCAKAINESEMSAKGIIS